MKNRIARSLASGLGAAAVLAGAPALGQAPPSPEEWQYREEPERCRAYRSIGTGEDRVLFQLRSYGPGSAIEATVVSALLPREPASVRMIELGWDGQRVADDQTGLLGSAGGIPSMTFLLANRPVSAFAFLDEGTTLVSPLDPANETLQLRVVGDPPMELRVGALEEPLRRLGECEARLMEKWGWGADYAQRVASAPVVLDPQSWFYRAITYPAVPRLKRVSSILQLRLKVDASGRVSECVAQSSPGSEQFGSKNCERIRNEARYRPALDPQGRPVDGLVQMSVIFAQYD